MPDPQRARSDRSRVRTAVVWDVLQGLLESLAGSPADGSGRRVLEILDAGGGTGGFAVPLAGRGHSITVVDPSPDALAALERRVAEATATGQVSGSVRALQGDVAGLLEVVEPASADLVLCHGVLEYVDDPAEALRALARCLRPGGALSLLAANRAAAVLSRAVAGRFPEAQHALEDPSGRWGDRDPMPRRFSREQLEQLLGAAGFTVGTVHGVRVFADLVPGALIDGEPGAVDALLALESAAAEQPAFLAIATQLHVLATLA